MNRVILLEGLLGKDHQFREKRNRAEDAARLVRQADCVFRVGGDATLQMALINKGRITMLTEEMLKTIENTQSLDRKENEER